MARKKGENKSELVRAMLAKGIQKPKDIIDAIKQEHGVDVTPGLVASVKVKYKKGSAKAAPKKRAARATSKGNGDFVSTLRTVVNAIGWDAVKKLVE